MGDVAWSQLDDATVLERRARMRWKSRGVREPDFESGSLGGSIGSIYESTIMSLDTVEDSTQMQLNDQQWLIQVNTVKKIKSTLKSSN